jgi:hypothetical protein
LTSPLSGKLGRWPAPARRLLAPFLFAAVAPVFPAGPGTASAQQGIRLTIVDDETGDAIVGALIKVKGRPDAATDDKGTATVEPLEAGRIQVQIRAIGYELREEYLVVPEGRLLERRIGLAFTGDKLPDIVVEARREKLSGRYQDFHRRQLAGSGHFIMWDEIKRRGFARLGDALKGVRGVQVNCRTHDCAISMSRSTSCPPTVWVDGREVPYFGVNTPIGDVYGIEIFRGSGEIPAEFAGTSACGAIAVWTKNKPYR